MLGINDLKQLALPHGDGMLANWQNMRWLMV